MTAQTSPRGPRIHSSFMDVGNHENEGIDIDELPELYVILLTDHDTFGKGKKRYTCIRPNVKTGEPFNDGLNYLYVNVNHSENAELAKLLRE